MIYRIPNTNSEKEKVIGGVLTFAQFLWLIMGLLITFSVFAIVFVVTRSNVISIVIAVPFLATGLPFAFKKKYGLTLFEYMKRKRVFEKKNKYLINKKGDF